MLPENVFRLRRSASSSGLITPPAHPKQRDRGKRDQSTKYVPSRIVSRSLPGFELTFCARTANFRAVTLTSFPLHGFKRYGGRTVIRKTVGMTGQLREKIFTSSTGIRTRVGRLTSYTRAANRLRNWPGRKSGEIFFKAV